MKRVFSSASDCKIYVAATQREAVVDSRAYAFIENEVFWPGFKKYLKERHNFEYKRTVAGIDHHKYAGVFQATVDRFVTFEGRVLLWEITNVLLEPEVWELEASELAFGMNQWSAIQRMPPLQLLRWYLKRR